MVQYLRCAGNRTWLAYAIVRSFPPCNCISSAPIVESYASVSKMKSSVRVGYARHGADDKALFKQSNAV